MNDAVDEADLAAAGGKDASSGLSKEDKKHLRMIEERQEA